MVRLKDNSKVLSIVTPAPLYFVLNTRYGIILNTFRYVLRPIREEMGVAFSNRRD